MTREPFPEDRMRLWLVVFALLAFGSKAEAQQLAQVNTVAHVRVPDFLFLEAGDVSEQTLADGKRMRRVTLYVTANRAWTLSVAHSCTTVCSAAEYKVSASKGRSGNTQEVVVEYIWDSTQRAPASDEFEYLLLGA